MTRAPLRLALLGAYALGPALLWAGAVAAQTPTQSLHGALPEGLTCLDCHTTEAWSPLAEDAEFDHADFGEGKVGLCSDSHE